MKPLNCVAIDDEPLALQLLTQYISKLPTVKLLEIFEDAVSASEYIQNHQVDILFVDINMPDISGVDLVRTLVNKPIVVFTTAYKQFAYEGFELEALDYLLKPIDFNRFNRAVEKAVDFYRYKNAEEKNDLPESLYVYSEYRMVKIALDKIEYIESMEDYIKINLNDQSKPVLTLMPLKKILEKLPESKFLRIHRSYIVATDKIKSIHNKKVELSALELPIGKSYNDAVMECLKGTRKV